MSIKMELGSFAMAAWAVAGIPVASTLMTDEYAGAAVTEAMKESAAMAMDDAYSVVKD